MSLTITDDELVDMSTADLRSIAERNRLSLDELKQLRNRRRRLQNRKYARKCALKKLTEVEKLASEIKEETAEVTNLRRQLNRLSVSMRRIQNQETMMVNFRKKLQSSVYLSDSKHWAPVRMLQVDGSLTGFAHPTRPPSDPFFHVSPASRFSSPAFGSKSPIRNTPNTDSGLWNSKRSTAPNNSVPLQLVAGPGMPSSASSYYSAWPPNDANPHNACLPMNLVRPVGCGFNAHGSHMSDY